MATPMLALQTPKTISPETIEEELAQFWRTQPGIGGPLASRAATFCLVIYEPEEFQQLLAGLGFYAGAIDGIHGDQTHRAIAQAQEKFGLIPTGYMDGATLTQLRQTYKALDSKPMLKNLDLRGVAAGNALTAQNPCRLITLAPLLGSQDDLTAQVSAYCPLHKSTINTLMCGEYITLRGSREIMEHCGELVNSLMLSDLPQYVWWKAHPHPDKPLFQSLASAGHSLIFDSAYLHRVEDGLLCYHELITRGSAVADLNWQRLLPWQELTASAFDPPERRNDLLAIRRLTVDYEKGNIAQALLFISWFASRLGWTPTVYRSLGGDYDVRQVDFQTPQGHLATAELGAIPIGNPGEIAGDLIGIRVSSGSHEEHTCAILCSETTGCMRMEAAGGAEACRSEVVVPPANESEEVLIGQQLQRSHLQDPLYEESLAMTTKILKLAQS